MHMLFHSKISLERYIQSRFTLSLNPWIFNFDITQTYVSLLTRLS